MAPAHWHTLRQLVGLIAKPLVIAMLLVAVAAICRACRRSRAAASLLITAAAIVFLSSMGWAGDALLGPLEREYPPLQDGALPKVGYIVVLGGGYAPNGAMPVTAALDEDGLVRIVEGVRLARRLGAVRLVVSGGALSRGEEPAAFGYAKLARDLGIDANSIVVLSASLDTRDEARSVAALIGAAPFILVTSAYHMPRAMRLMERAGARPIPAPTGQLVNRSMSGGWTELLPTARGLVKTERAVHEYLGIAALRAGVNE